MTSSEYKALARVEGKVDVDRRDGKVTATIGDIDLITLLEAFGEARIAVEIRSVDPDETRIY